MNLHFPALLYFGRSRSGGRREVLEIEKRDN